MQDYHRQHTHNYLTLPAVLEVDLDQLQQPSSLPQATQNHVCGHRHLLEAVVALVGSVVQAAQMDHLGHGDLVAYSKHEMIR